MSDYTNDYFYTICLQAASLCNPILHLHLTAWCKRIVFLSKFCLSVRQTRACWTDWRYFWYSIGYERSFSDTTCSCYLQSTFLYWALYSIVAVCQMFYKPMMITIHGLVGLPSLSKTSKNADFYRFPFFYILASTVLKACEKIQLSLLWSYAVNWRWNLYTFLRIKQSKYSYLNIKWQHFCPSHAYPLAKLHFGG